MRRVASAMACAALAFGTVACSTVPSPDFQTQVAPGASLSSYRTYAWAFDGPGASGSPNVSPIVMQKIRDDLDAGLRSSGLTPASKDSADMIVGYTVGARDKVDVTDWGPIGPYYPAYGRGYRWGWAYPYNNVDVQNVTEGSLALDVYDAKTNRPVWHGIATERIGSSGASDELIDAAVQGLVSRFMADRGPATSN